MIDFKDLNLFWQYPVITEEEFFNQNKKYSNFIGVPWATIIDKNIDLNDVLYHVRPQIKNSNNYTCCQHIHFRTLVPLFKSLNINRLYTSHKIINEDVVDDIKLISCPLYAVNIEDVNRNLKFKDVDFINTERDIFYSFTGASMRHYLSDVRERIFNMSHPSDCVVRNTDVWHFEEQVYSDAQNASGSTITDDSSIDMYNDLLMRSRFSLCPGGAGPNTIRFWESLGAGSIPVLLSDTYELPRHELWDDTIIRVEERDVTNIVEILSTVPEETVFKMRVNCLKIYNHFRKNYINEPLS